MYQELWSCPFQILFIYFLTWPPIPQSFNHDDRVLIGHDESLTKILLQFRSADIKADPQFDAPFAHLKNTNTAMLFRLLLTLATLCFPDMCTEVNCGQGSLLNIVVLTEIYQEAKREKVEEANEKCTVVHQNQSVALSQTISIGVWFN